MQIYKYVGLFIYTVAIQFWNTMFQISKQYYTCWHLNCSFLYAVQVRTCKMGPGSDPDAVVDPRLRVHGIQRLRIIDLSIAPINPTCHTNPLAMAIGEKGSDLIKEDWGVSWSNETRSKLGLRSVDLQVWATICNFYVHQDAPYIT